MTNEFFVGVLWGLPFLGMPPFFCVKKGQTGANQSIPYNSLRTPITAFLWLVTILFIQSVIKSRTANSGANAGHLCVYNVTALPAIIL